MKRLILALLMISPVYAADPVYEQQPGSVATPYNTTIDKRIISAHTRNVVMKAHVNSIGSPDFITATAGSISIDGTVTPIVLTIADGFTQYGQLDYVLSLKSKITLQATDGWLYGVYNVNTGALTVQVTSTQPINAVVLPNSAAIGQLAWTTVDQRSYTWDGKSWNITPAMVFGQYFSTGSFVYSTGGPTGTVVSSGTFTGNGTIVSVTNSNFTSSNTINQVFNSYFTSSNTITSADYSTFSGTTSVNTADNGTFTGNGTVTNASGTFSGSNTIARVDSGEFTSTNTVNYVEKGTFNGETYVDLSNGTLTTNSTTTINNSNSTINNYGTIYENSKKKSVFGTLTINSMEILNAIQ